MNSDAHLVSRTLAGDSAAFAELVRRYECTVLATARAILHDHHAAEDAAQDAFIAAYQALPTLHTPAAFAPWVCRILRRRATELAIRRRKLTPTGRADDLAQVTSTERTLDADAQDLLACLSALPENEQQVLMLRHFDGLDVQTIASFTGQSVGTITKRISRGHARLRQRLQRKEYLP